MMEYRFFPTGTMDVQEFRRLCEISFHQKNNEILPSNVVVIYEDGKYVGFFDLSMLGQTSVYLKYIGFSEFTPSTLRWCKGAIEYVHSLGYEKIFGGILENNRLALIWALRQGFRVMGFKVIDGIGTVEIIKDPKKTGSYKRGLL